MCQHLSPFEYKSESQTDLPSRRYPALQPSLQTIPNMMRAILAILTSLVVVSVMSNPDGNKIAKERGYLLCTQYVNLRKWCTNSYNTKCTSNANCTSPYSSCVKYTPMRGLFFWYDLHSDSFCTQTTKPWMIWPSCANLAKTWLC